MSEPAAPAAAPVAPVPPRRPRLPLPVARLIARLVRGSTVGTTVLLGAASILTAFSAYQATQYSNVAGDNQALAQRVNVDSTTAVQAAYAEHQSDTQTWLAIVSSGQSVDDSPLGGLLSQRWLDALERASAEGTDVAADGTLIPPLDDRYYRELLIEASAFKQTTDDAQVRADRATAISARITGSSIMYSAALLLLTVATSATRDSARFGLNLGAFAIIVAALVVGWATPIF